MRTKVRDINLHKLIATKTINIKPNVDKKLLSCKTVNIHEYLHCKYVSLTVKDPETNCVVAKISFCFFLLRTNSKKCVTLHHNEGRKGNDSRRLFRQSQESQTIKVLFTFVYIDHKFNYNFIA